MQETLIIMAYLLGIRHGFDLDHLATIDSITRIVSPNRYLSKVVGFLFSFGHGLVVILISLIVGNGFAPSHIPEWLNEVGDSISISFLFLFAFLTLWNVFQHPSKSPLPTSLKNYLSRKLIKKNINPIYIVSIGILFAFSFDTVSQVVLFSLSAKAMAGFLFSGLLGIVFMLGMMTSDGLNGLFVSTLIQRADTRSLLLSRMSGLIIASFSLIVGIMNCLKVYS
ncbi:DNA repair protein [Legionella parisiensis]|uniref:Nickel/cobalt efflux system n=1 Tax=Legionella parisiensis TaxID=45071 RepID=A0A1E5JW45_9GAMM|nr:DNA repair protein [Legionella parisiensis]KTD40574.1 high-affinity nickel-transport protein [Legionella parisiensis]OEH48731.1 High-affinity nickel-transport protein NixA [Legionella parisiensis]STX77033.1 high-affinity nickel-transport protein [Legionella parisiensis]